jgi:hypothetical protein
MLIPYRPISEVCHIKQLHTDATVMVLPNVIHDLNPSAQPEDALHLPKRPLEYTRGQIRKLIKGTKPKGEGNSIRNKRWEHLASGQGAVEGEGSSSPIDNGPGPSMQTTPTLQEARVVSLKSRNVRDGVEVPQFVTRGGAQPVVPREEAAEEDGAGVGGDVMPEMRLDVRDEEAAEARNRG